MSIWRIEILGRFGDGTPSQFVEYFYECRQCGKSEGGVKFTKNKRRDSYCRCFLHLIFAGFIKSLHNLPRLQADQWSAWNETFERYRERYQATFRAYCRLYWSHAFEEKKPRLRLICSLTHVITPKKPYWPLFPKICHFDCFGCVATLTPFKMIHHFVWLGQFAKLTGQKFAKLTHSHRCTSDFFIHFLFEELFFHTRPQAKFLPALFISHSKCSSWWDP